MKYVRVPKKSKITTIVLSVLLFTIIAIRFKPIFLTLGFSVIVFVSKYYRQVYNFPVTIEPIYTTSVILGIVFGLEYGMFIILVPNILAELFSGRLTGGILVNVFNKTLVLLVCVYFANISNISWLFALSVIISDIIGIPLKLTLGQPITDILGTVGFNGFMRIIYFNSWGLAMLKWML